MRHALPLLLAAAVAGTVACKKRPSAAQESPEATVKAFFKAINDKRIPKDLANFISDPKELHTMRFRCKDRRCRRADFRISGEQDRTGYSIVLLVDYKVFGEDGSIALNGKKSPIHLELLGKRWLIKSMGRKRVAKPKPKPGSAAASDAGTAPSDAQTD